MIGRRGVALLVPALAAACARTQMPPAAPESFPPLRYDYLTPIRLNVASIEVEPRFVPAGTRDDVTASAPVPLMDAIGQMAQDRFQALGTSGRAVMAINDATIVRRGGAFEGSVAVQLDIYTSTGVRAAFVEARVGGRRTIGDESTRKALYELTKQLMDALNVEIEFQVRRSLRDWLVTTPAGVPEPVEQQSLPAPQPPSPQPPAARSQPGV